MTIRIYTNDGNIDVITAATVTVDKLLKQLEEGNLVLVETIYGSTFIINCMNINAVELFNNNTNIPPIQS